MSTSHLLLSNVHWNAARLLIPIAAICLAGCATLNGFPERVPTPENDLQSLEMVMGADKLVNCLDAVNETCRNRLVGARMYAIDIQFSLFEERLFKQTRATNFSATLLTLGLTAGAAGATGGASQVLSGIAALVIGGREAYQKEVLAEKTVLAIHAAMRARRLEVLLRLRSGLLQPLSRYPITVAMSDVNDYFNAGTVLGALVGITEVAGANAQKAETELRERFSYKPSELSEKLKLAYCGSPIECSKPNQEVLKRMRECWPQGGLNENTDVVDFTLQEVYSRQRALVAACMGL